jgi:PAS domain S-box-containing protein
MEVNNNKSATMRILFLEDAPQDAELCRELITNSGYLVEMDIVTTEKEFESCLSAKTYDIILSDFQLPGFDAFGALRLCSKVCPQVPFICVSGVIGEETAIELLKLGAVDYVLKDRPDRLPYALKRAIDDSREKEARQKAQASLIASEVQYRRLFETAKDGILILDAETGKIVDVNPFLIELLDYSKEQFIQKNIWEIGCFKDILANYEKFVELQKNDYVRYENLPLETADGKKIHVEFVSNVYLVNQKRVIQCNIRDITERMRAEVETARLAAIVESSDDIILSKTLDGIITSWNKGAEKIYHLSKDDAIGSSILRIIPEEHKSEEKEILGKIQSGLTFNSIETERVTKDGMHIQVSLTITPIRDREGRITGVATIGHDITARKRAEEQIRYHASLLENVNDAIIATDAHCLITAWNAAAAALYGWNTEEVLGRNVLEIIKTEWPEALVEEMRRVIRETGRWFGEGTQVRKDGTRIPVEVSSFMLRDSNGQIFGYVSSNRDITVRKRAAEEYAMLAHALKSINECVSITDLESKILFVNKSFSDTYGYDAKELIGKNMSVVRSSKNPPELIQSILSATFCGGWQGEMWNLKKDGSEFLISLSTTILNDKNGKHLGLIGVSTDITERKYYEATLLEAKEKAEEMNRLKSTLLSSMSHELRTPLISILGYSEMIEEETMDGSIKGMARNINNGGKRLLSTLNNVLQFSKLESTEIKPNFEKINVNELLQGVAQRYAKLLKSKNIDLIIKFAADPVYGWLDNMLLTDICNNLIQNAVKFTVKGSIQVCTEINEAHIIIKVIDTGVGIADENLKMIFEEFRQASEGLNRSFEGSGLGLTIVKRFCKLLGGEVAVESTLNSGSVFTLQFPNPHLLGTEIGTADPGKKPLSSSASLPNILYVEDDSTTFFVIERFLQGVCTVENAKNGDDALKKVLTDGYDLFLMDINLGSGMNGKEVAKHIREFPRYKNTPVIAVTAYAMHGDREEILAAGCSGYIAKPFRKQELVDLVTMALKKK